MSIPTPHVSRKERRRRRRHVIYAGVSITVITLLLVFAMTWWILWQWSATPGGADPYPGVPSCTHEIANAGGICHGNPQ